VGRNLPVATHAIHKRFVAEGGRSVRGFVKHGIDRPFVVLAGWNGLELTASDRELVRDDESVRVQYVLAYVVLA
jgi:hypothetical protein